MYQDTVKTQDQALCHLFFHCCLQDDIFSAAEVDNVSEKLVSLGLQANMNFKEELVSYRSYKSTISDQMAYLRFLFSLINPVNDLALYSYCAELCFSDPQLDAREDSLLRKIGDALEITTESQDTVKKLMAQRKAVELQKIF